MTEKEQVRLSVNITPEVAAAIRELADSRGMTVSELVRDALATERYFAERRAQDEAILLRARDGTIREVVFR